MEYLSGIDNLFLHQESQTQHMHVAGLGIYDPSTAPGGKVRFKSILDFFVHRMADEPVFRRRLVKNPLVIDRPVWVADPTVDVEYHVRHLAVPYPGDWRQLMIQIARIHSRPLDMARPPWEVYIIDGLDNIDGLPEGSFALYIKLHHAAIDGESGAHLIGSLHSLTPEVDASREESRHTIIADREPTTLELMANAVSHSSRQVVGVGALGMSLGKHLVRQASDPLALVGKGWEMFAKQLDQLTNPEPRRPDTRFNRKISPHRVLDAVGIDLERCRMIREDVGGATVNDIFLTVVGGALRQYLAETDGAPSGSLMGTMPMTLRGSDKGGSGNQIAQVYYSLHTDIDDPVDRLMAVREETAGVKEETQSGLGPDIQMRMLDVLPASLIATMLTNELGARANVNVSNVRGPGSALYMAGARLERFIPFSLILDGCGLNLTGFSYKGVLWVALTCCRNMLPDPDRFMSAVTSSFDELAEAAERYAGNKKATAAKRRKKTGRGRKKTATGRKKARRKKKVPASGKA